MDNFIKKGFQGARKFFKQLLLPSSGKKGRKKASGGRSPRSSSLSRCSGVVDADAEDDSAVMAELPWKFDSIKPHKMRDMSATSAREWRGVLVFEAAEGRSGHRDLLVVQPSSCDDAYGMDATGDGDTGMKVSLPDVWCCVLEGCKAIGPLDVTVFLQGPDHERFRDLVFDLLLRPEYVGGLPELQIPLANSVIAPPKSRPKTSSKSVARFPSMRGSPAAGTTENLGRHSVQGNSRPSARSSGIQARTKQRRAKQMQEAAVGAQGRDQKRVSERSVRRMLSLSPSTPHRNQVVMQPQHQPPKPNSYSPEYHHHSAPRARYDRYPQRWIAPHRRSHLLSFASRSGSSRGSPMSQGGIPNLGNTCFLNAVLQLLLLNSDFRERVSAATQGAAPESSRILTQLAKVGKCLTSENTARELMEAVIAEFLAVMAEENPNFASGRQEDAHEFFNYLTSCVHEEVSEWLRKHPRGHAQPAQPAQPDDGQDCSSASSSSSSSSSSSNSSAVDLGMSDDDVDDEGANEPRSSADQALIDGDGDGDGDGDKQSMMDDEALKTVVVTRFEREVESSRRQQDADAAILEQVANKSPCSLTLASFFEKELICTACGHRRVLVDPPHYAVTLDLPAQHRIRDPLNVQMLIDKFLEQDCIEYRCEAEDCSSNEAATQFRWRVPPESLYFHINRFEFNRVAKRTVKRHDTVDLSPLVEVPVVADFKPSCTAQAVVAAERERFEQSQRKFELSVEETRVEIEAGKYPANLLSVPPASTDEVVQVDGGEDGSDHEKDITMQVLPPENGDDENAAQREAVIAKAFGDVEEARTRLNLLKAEYMDSPVESPRRREYKELLIMTWTEVREREEKFAELKRSLGDASLEERPEEPVSLKRKHELAGSSSSLSSPLASPSPAKSTPSAPAQPSLKRQRVMGPAHSRDAFTDAQCEEVVLQEALRASLEECDGEGGAGDVLMTDAAANAQDDDDGGGGGGGDGGSRGDSAGSEGNLPSSDFRDASQIQMLSYRLVGVLKHRGNSANSGHYVTDLLRVTSNSKESFEEWYRYDDDSVTKMRGTEEEVVNDVKGRTEAYILFYKRADLMQYIY